MKRKVYFFTHYNGMVLTKREIEILSSLVPKEIEFWIDRNDHLKTIRNYSATLTWQYQKFFSDLTLNLDYENVKIINQMIKANCLSLDNIKKLFKINNNIYLCDLTQLCNFYKLSLDIISKSE